MSLMRHRYWWLVAIKKLAVADRKKHKYQVLSDNLYKKSYKNIYPCKKADLSELFLLIFLKEA